MKKSCERCAKEFSCGAESGKGPCWCTQLPVATEIPLEFADCLCPECLAIFVEKAPAPPELIENQDFYFDPNGNMVFTEQYHLKRGYCCKNNCRHCPYSA